MRSIVTTNSDDHIGLAVIRSLAKNNLDFQVLSRTRNTIGLSSRYCKNKTIGNFDLNFFSKLSNDNVILPMVEDTMVLLSKNRSHLQCQLGFSDYEIIQKTRDKSLLMQHAIEHKIPCPKTLFVKNHEDIRQCNSAMVFPVVLKPSHGSGGKGIVFVDSLKKLQNIADKYLELYGPFLIQEKIPFTSKYTVGALCNSNSELKRVCVIKELRNYPIETGQACYVETVDDPKLIDMSEKLLKSLNFFGIADIDYIIDSRDNKPKLMEINPRFWGSMQVAINSGVDFPSLLCRMLADGDIERSLSYKTGVRCRYVFFNDLFRLASVMQGKYTFTEKRQFLHDFLRFPRTDGYYVYSPDDLLPFFELAYIKIARKLHLIG